MIIASFCSNFSHANAKRELNQLRFVTISQPLYGFYNEENQPTGILFDILALVNQDLGGIYSHKILPSKRIAQELAKGGQVCSIIANTYEIKDTHQLIMPVGIKFSVGLIIKKPAFAETYQHLYALRNIAVPLGIQFDKQFDQDTKLNIVRPTEYDNAIQMLRSNRVDAVAGSIPTLQHLAWQYGIKPQELNEPFIFHSNEFYLVCSQQVQGETKARLIDTLGRLIKQNKVKEIVIKYSGSTQNTAQLELGNN